MTSEKNSLADEDDDKTFIDDLTRSLKNVTGKTVDDIAEPGSGTTSLFFTRIDWCYRHRL